MLGRCLRESGFRTLSVLLTTAAILAVASTAGLIVHATMAKASLIPTGMGAIPRFGGQTLISGDFRVLEDMGAGLYEVVGNATTWSVLQPDGQTFSAKTLADLDVQVRQAFDLGITDLELRVTTGGPGQAFSALPDQSTWPVDTIDYGKAPYNGYKGGEYIGGRAGCIPGCAYKFPIKDYSDSGPFYRFVFDLVSRYDGNTPDPDPKRSGRNLPQVHVWSVAEEPDVKGYWYGTTTEYFGGVGGDQNAGLAPVFARAVKAANPNAIVIAGGLTSQNLGLYLAHQLAKSRGNVYDSVVRDYGRAYFHTWSAMQDLFNSNLTDSQLFQQFQDDRERARARLFVERSLVPTFADHLDGVAFHMYENPRMLKDVIDLYRSHLPGKPLWATEIGFTDNPPAGGQTWVTEDAQAEWLFKKLIIGLAEDLANASYYPLYNYGLATSGFRELFPTMTTWRAAFRTMHMLGNTLNEKSGFSYAGQVTRGGTTFYLFNTADGLSHAAAAWNDDGTDTLDARTVLGIPQGAQSFVFDKTEAPVPGTDPSNLAFSSQPLFIVWSNANIDVDGDGYPRFFDCNDADPNVHPGMTEISGNGTDDDCNPISQPPSCLTIVPSGEGATTTTTRVVNLGILLLPIIILSLRKALVPYPTRRRRA